MVCCFYSTIRFSKTIKKLLLPPEHESFMPLFVIESPILSIDNSKIHELVKDKEEVEITKEREIERGEESSKTFLERIGFEKFQALVFENKVKIKGLLQEHHEKTLLSKLESMCQKQVSIADILGLQTGMDNMSFFASQTEVDRKLILALAPKDFLDTLSPELREESKVLQQRVASMDQRENQNINIESDSDSEEEEEEQKENNVVLEQALVREVDSDFGSEGNIENDAIEMNDILTDSLANDAEENEKALGIKDVSNLEEDALKGGDKELATDKDNDLPFMSEVIDFEKESKVFDNQTSEGSNPLENEIQIEKSEILENPNKEEPMEVVFEIQATGNPPEREDENDDIDGNEEVPEILHQIPDNKDSYDWLCQMNTDREDYELQFFKCRVPLIESLKKKLQDHGILQASTAILTEDLPVFDGLEAFMNQIVLLLQSDKSSDELYPRPTFCRMNLCSLINKYLILQLLDPVKEADVIPLLVLYLMDYTPKFVQHSPKRITLNSRIIEILYQYALRSPSVFFRSLEWSKISTYFDKEKFAIGKDSTGTFTLFDLLFKYYLSCCTKRSKNNSTDNILPKILYFLIQVRFMGKDEGTPKFILSLQESNIQILEGNTLDQLLNVSEKNNNIATKIGTRRFCQWLKYLSYAPQYRSAIFQVCGQMLSIFTPKGQEKIQSFITNAKELFKLSPENIAPKQRDKCSNLLMQIQLDSSDILDVLDFSVCEAGKGVFDVQSVIKENNTCNKKFNEISLFHLEALDLAYKLVEKNLVNNSRELKKQLRDLLRLPFQFYLYLIKLKQLEPTVQVNEDHSVSTLMAKRDVSITDSMPAPTLERSYSLLRKEEDNFEETFLQWMTKSKDLLGDILSDSNQDQRNYDLYMQAMRKFPWTLSFQLKDRILRFYI